MKIMDNLRFQQPPLKTSSVPPEVSLTLPITSRVSLTPSVTSTQPILYTKEELISEGYHPLLFKKQGGDGLMQFVAY
jgi:hypothetical protein